MRHYGRKKKCQYLVRWKGYPDSDNKWVDHKDMNASEALKRIKAGSVASLVPLAR